MTKIPDSILSVSSLLLHIFLVPVFYLCFVLFYASEWIMEFYDAGLGIVFNTLMTMCILIGVLCLSRIPMTACRHRLTLTWRDYMLWSGAEFIVFSCFAALYMALVRKHYGYFPAFVLLIIVFDLACVFCLIVGHDLIRILTCIDQLRQLLPAHLSQLIEILCLILLSFRHTLSLRVIRFPAALSGNFFGTSGIAAVFPTGYRNMTHP